MLPPSRRPGPRSDIDVRGLLLDAAESMFGRDGVDAVSLRAICRRAGVAPAALTHHFESKSALLKAVIARRSTPLGGEVRARLHKVARGSPTTTSLVDAILPPFVEMIDSCPAGGAAWIKILMSTALSDSDIWADELQGKESVSELYLTVARQALPLLTESALRQRSIIAMFSMMAALAGADLPGYGAPLTTRGLDDEFVRQLRSFTIGGLEVALP